MGGGWGNEESVSDFTVLYGGTREMEYIEHTSYHTFYQISKQTPNPSPSTKS